MPIDKINGVKIFWELTGSKGEPLVLVHGSWGDHHNWDMVAGEFAKTFRVLTYDRRGHSESERLPGQGSVEEDVEDLIELINYLNLSPAHIAGNSYGAGIALKTAAKRPDLFKSMVIHEPPLFGILKDNPNAREALQLVDGRIKVVLDLFAEGNLQKATEEFMEKIAMGTGAWEKLPEAVKRTFIYNAPTWYDEMQDPQSLQIDINTLSNYKKPALLSSGSESPIFFPLVINKLMSVIPHAKRITFEGAGHVPHMSHSEKYIETVSNFCFSIGN
ncbi:alpha/beta hydrolase [Ginsengibacter hankyongi]|uniref:Alpha/beta hydrolase n=1 Tax=Ginsengibacter hankyongi TaxID=2607284 RepID=A0A5J5ICN9_9BACT|nr:alpha/beta hydrolase [Ginsengibacter hankyongi]KAA9035944.1 alpha/beta hydrolase [Ginsengibacter hankyongi]